VLAHRERRDPSIDARPPQFGPMTGLSAPSPLIRPILAAKPRREKTESLRLVTEA